jgi:hypothetical protein
VGVLDDPTKTSAEAGCAVQAAADGIYVEIVRDTLRVHEGAG